MRPRLGEKGAIVFDKIGISPALLDAGVFLQCLAPERRCAGGVVADPEDSLVVGNLGADRIQCPLGCESGIDDLRVAIARNFAVAEFPVKTALHRAETELRVTQRGRLLKASFCIQFSNFPHDNLTPVGREGMFVEPLGTDEYRPAGEKDRAGDAENQTLHKPCTAFLSLSRRGISKRQTSQHEHPPSQFNAVKRDIHKTMQHRRKRSGDDSPTQRPGTTLSQAKNIRDQQCQQSQCK